MVIASLNINSIRYKFEQLKFLIEDKVDILIIQETKLDETFPDGQFLLNGFSPPYRKDRNKHGGGILIYVRDNIPSKLLNEFQPPNDIEGLFIELNFRNNKWLLFGSYHPPNQCSKYYFSEVGITLEKYQSKYDKYVLVGDFNREETEPVLDNFMVDFGLNNIVKDKTCYKNRDNPKCIDLILTNKRRMFQNTTTIDIGISDFHKMVLTSFKSKYEPGKPKEVVYRNYKHFNNDNFREELKAATGDTCNTWDSFETRFLNILNKHAPIKKKTIRGNHAPYMTKSLKKAIMKRTQLANKYHKHSNEENFKNFKKQKNFANRLYKREKKPFIKNYL